MQSFFQSRICQPTYKALRPNITGSESLERVCPDCVRIFQRAQEQLRQRPNIFTDAMSLADAGPNECRLTLYRSRHHDRVPRLRFLRAQGSDRTKDKKILAYHSIFAVEGDSTLLYNPDVASWHGMMTSVVAAGNGFLSESLYRGIAPDANVVLVKIGKTGHIPETDIERGLRWVLSEQRQVREFASLTFLQAVISGKRTCAILSAHLLKRWLMRV